MPKQKLVTRTLTLPNGTRKYFRGKTEKEVEQKLFQARMQLCQGIDISNDMTFEELSQIWYDTFKKGRLREGSLESIRSALNRYVIPKIGALKVQDIKPLHIQGILQSMSGLSQSAQRQVTGVLKPIFSLAVDNAIISRSPVVSSIKPRGAAAEPVEPLTRGQTDTLLHATEGTRAYTFIALALYAGLRKGEIVGLRWGDVDFQKGIIHVRRSVVYTQEHREGLLNEELKTAAARRDIPVPFALIEYLKTQRAVSNSIYVLSQRNGAYLSSGAFNNVWDVVKRRSMSTQTKRSLAPRTIDFGVHPHQLRHTCITRWFEAGLDLKQIQYLAGHSSIEMTLRIYTHYDRKSRETETAEKIRAAVPALVSFE